MNKMNENLQIYLMWSLIVVLRSKFVFSYSTGEFCNHLYCFGFEKGTHDEKNQKGTSHADRQVATWKFLI